MRINQKCSQVVEVSSLVGDGIIVGGKRVSTAEDSSRGSESLGLSTY